MVKDNGFSERARAWHGSAHSTVAPRGGLLLCHGFTSTPQSLRDWGEDHAARGWEVSLPLLPGHGASWRELARTPWQEWAGAVREAAHGLAAHHGSIAVGGLSMGGALALALAEDPRTAPLVDSLVLVNPAVALPRAQAIALPVLQHLVPSIAPIASDTANGAAEEAYDRTPVRAVEQMRRLQRRVRRGLAEVRCPVLLATSVEDHVVDPRCSDLVARTVSGPVERLALTRSHHVATLDHDAPLLFARSAAFLGAVAAHA